MSATATPQYEQALALANQIRLASCRWRNKVARQTPANARITLARTLEQNGFPPEIGALKLRRFLTAATGIGPGKAGEICNEAGLVRRDPRIRDLTLRERSALAVALRRRAAITEATRRGERLR